MPEYMMTVPEYIVTVPEYMVTVPNFENTHALQQLRLLYPTMMDYLSSIQNGLQIFQVTRNIQYEPDLVRVKCLSLLMFYH